MPRGICARARARARVFACARASVYQYLLQYADLGHERLLVADFALIDFLHRVLLAGLFVNALVHHREVSSMSMW